VMRRGSNLFIIVRKLYFSLVSARKKVRFH
jgi:hypothetical protein